MRHHLVAIVLVTTLALALPGLTAADAAPSPAPVTTPAGGPTSPASVHVAVQVRRFYATAAGTKASGVATATLTPIGQLPTTVSKDVTLAATSSGTCTILTLTLETLELKLLGINVHLEKVVLNVTGQPHGGVLGSLFCSLARAKAKAARASAAAHINGTLRRDGALEPLALSAGVRAQIAEAPAPTCPILNLVLGPLHLDLLGLVVDLNQVHLTIVAEPTGGVLGSLFCGLANTKI